MLQLEQYNAAEFLEQYLGDPTNTASIMSFKKSIEQDESEEFPEAEIQLLYRWGMDLYYVPIEYGGKLRSFEECFALIRVIARRDVSIAVTNMHTFLGALPVWLRGSEQQKRRMAEFVNSGGYACLAVSEKAHGSDLLATETQAEKGADGYYLSGEKWPINKATHTHALTVLAKTDDKGTSRSLSLFLVYKQDLDPVSYRHLPKIKTLGLRSSDISGIQFKNSHLPEDALLGPIGSGLDLTLQGFFLTRTLCTFLSLGAADTGLRTTIRLANSRKLYGKTVFELPHARGIIVNAFLDILICDCVAISAARAIHVVPKQFSVWSAIAKTFVPKRIERTLDDLAVVLGARYYLREDHDGGLFQKIFRDNGVISVFDGSSVVNLYALILQLRQLAKARGKMDAQTLANVQSRLETVFKLDQPLPPFDGTQLELFSRGCNDVLQGLESAVTQLQSLETDSSVNPKVLQQLIGLTNTLLEELAALEEYLLNAQIEASHEQSFDSFERAKQYCTIHAAAACVLMWLHNRVTLGDFFAKGEWLVLCLSRLLTSFRPALATVSQEYMENVAEELLKLHVENRMFSIVPFQLAGADMQAGADFAVPEIQLQKA